jgi:coproporphyrinogen III oxidase-like Fe-S oxidoreductase
MTAAELQVLVRANSNVQSFKDRNQKMVQRQQKWWGDKQLMEGRMVSSLEFFDVFMLA